ncbi:hypothetical protein K431DRAFT_334501 [Polychaeton citri CBS 116435]|uniref:Uncharacterized protein n=1 Tax=Polychaeton citri CBS 116435 TaxID=1314669 RepID=A0A9P4Q2P0_9PEZI|nr:hypothetical protein K431DRAFT_334501 [Polychaeton citri CBS 116435]
MASVTPFTTGLKEAPYLTGLRGILVLESLLWIYFQTFIPALVPNNRTPTPGPSSQKAIRDIFSPLLWNGSFIASFFLVLSARSICVKFLASAGPQTLAGTLIRRTVRMVLSIAFASGIAMAILKSIGTGYIDDFKAALPNESIATPGTAENGLVALNSMFDLFWVVRDFSTQAANTFWPSGTLWSPSLIYYQGWTVYILMVLMPYTRKEWQVQGLGLFAAGSFWMNSWGWYSATALLLAAKVLDPSSRQQLTEGIKLTDNFVLPTFFPAILLTVGGLAFKYAWTAFPQYADKMLVLHPFLDISETTNPAAFAAADPYPRIDNYMLIFGILLFVESAPKVQSLLSARPLVWLGNRSFSFFVAQSIVFWTISIKLWLLLHIEQQANTASANAAAFFVGLVATAVFAELYHRIIDMPSRWVAKNTYDWLID